MISLAKRNSYIHQRSHNSLIFKGDNDFKCHIWFWVSIFIFFYIWQISILTSCKRGGNEWNNKQKDLRKMSGHLVHVWTKLYTFLDLPYLYQKLTKSIFERWKTCKYFQVNNNDAETDIFLGIILSHTVSICGLFFCVVIIAVNWRYIIYNLMCCKQIFSKDFYKFFKTEQV